MAFFTPPGIVNQVKAGKVRALAVTTSTRSPDLPDVPTLQELGIDINITNWNGFFLPAGTPKPIVDKLTAELRHVVLNTDAKDKLRNMFTNPVGLTPEDSAKRIETDTALWKRCDRQGAVEVRELSELPTGQFSTAAEPLNARDEQG